MSEDIAKESAGPNAEQLRDERVVPVVQGVLRDMAEDIAATDVNANNDFTSLLVKILTRGLEADLNVTTENPYMFQLVLNAYSAFSAAVQECKVADAQDERYGRIGKEMMGLLVKANIPLGTKVTPEEQKAATDIVKPELEALFLRENLQWLEVKYILEGLFRALKGVESLYSSNIDLSVQRMEAKILGISEMSDLTMKKLDETLQADFAELKAKG